MPGFFFTTGLGTTFGSGSGAGAGGGAAGAGGAAAGATDFVAEELGRLVLCATDCLAAGALPAGRASSSAPGSSVACSRTMWTHLDHVIVAVADLAAGERS